MSTTPRKFQGVWIPAEVWLDRGLSITEKVMLVEIGSLQDEERGCYASNAHFAEFFDLSVSRVSEIISGLAAKGLVEIERRTMETQKAVAAIEQKVDQLQHSSVWDHCPQNCEPITKIRARISKRHGLPPHVVDTVMCGLPLSPKIAGMVRNNHEDAEGSHYAVWAVADVTRTFKRFVSECERVSTWFATHPDIDGRFKLAPEVEA